MTQLKTCLNVLSQVNETTPLGSIVGVLNFMDKDYGSDGLFTINPVLLGKATFVFYYFDLELLDKGG